MAHRLMPISALPATPGITFPDARQTANSTFWVEGLSIIGSPGSDGELHYIWEMPPTLPSGTAKLELTVLPENTGNISVNPYWKSVAASESLDLDTGNLNSEGLLSATYNSADIDTLDRLTVNLDADTIVANEYVVMRLVLDSGNWTVTSRTLFLPSIIWE